MIENALLDHPKTRQNETKTTKSFSKTEANKKMEIAPIRALERDIGGRGPGHLVKPHILRKA